MLNGVTDLIMTKADVLTGIETIKVCEAYNVDNKIVEMPDFAPNAIPQTINREFKGWKEDISDIKDVEHLPDELRDYSQFVEKVTGSHLSYISTGPDRDQIIKF